MNESMSEKESQFVQKLSMKNEQTRTALQVMVLPKLGDLEIVFKYRDMIKNCLDSNVPGLEDAAARAFSTLLSCPRFQERIIPFLKSAFLSTIPEIRAGILHAIGKAGESGRRLGSLVMDGLSDPEPRVRADAAKAAGRIGFEGAISKLIALLGDESESCRNRAAVALGQLKTERTALLLTLELRRPGGIDDTYFELIAWELSTMGSVASCAEEDLRPYLGSAKTRIRTITLCVLWTILPPQRAAKELLPMLLDLLELGISETAEWSKGVPEESLAKEDMHEQAPESAQYAIWIMEALTAACDYRHFGLHGERALQTISQLAESRFTAFWANALRVLRSWSIPYSSIAALLHRVFIKLQEEMEAQPQILPIWGRMLIELIEAHSEHTTWTLPALRQMLSGIREQSSKQALLKTVKLLEKAQG